MRRILRLEDSPEDAFLIENTLREGGIDADITVVRHRAEFLAALEQNRFDLILSDHGLCDIDSVTAIAMATAKWPDIWFICLSGTEDPEIIQKCLDAGAAAYISKRNLPKLINMLAKGRMDPGLPSRLIFLPFSSLCQTAYAIFAANTS